MLFQEYMSFVLKAANLRHSLKAETSGLGVVVQEGRADYKPSYSRAVGTRFDKNLG